jgi:hypothetical protein
MINKHLLKICGFSLITVAIFLNGCSNSEKLTSGNSSSPGVANIHLSTTSNSTFSKIADSAVITVFASDMATITQQLLLTDTTVTGTISGIPAGFDRIFEITVFDSLKKKQYYGCDTTTVYPDSIISLPINIKRIGTTGSVVVNSNIIENDSIPSIDSISSDTTNSDTTLIDTTGPISNITIVPANLIAFFPFNGNSLDESGHGNNGVVYGAASCADRLNASRKAYMFSGNDSIIIKNDTLDDFGSNSFSVCFWIKAVLGNDFCVLGKSDGGIPNYLFSDSLSGPGWNIQVENTPEYGRGLRLDLWDGSNGNYNIVHDSSAIDGKWHFVAFIIDRIKGAQMYVDCVKKSQTDISAIGSVANKEPIRIGKRADWSSLFTGSLDQVRFYTATLSQAQVDSIYNNELKVSH